LFTSASTAPFKLLGGGFALFRLDVGDDDLGAVGRKPLGTGKADALRPPGDDRHFSGQSHAIPLPSILSCQSSRR
jgi:hypothetical protein